MTGSSFCIKFALCLGCLAGSALAFGQAPANLSAEGLGPSAASLSANPSAGNGMVSGGGGSGGGGARASLRMSASSDTGVRSGSRTLSSTRAMKAGSSLVSYGPTQATAPYLGYQQTGTAPIHISSSFGSTGSILTGLHHGGLSAPGGWGSSSGSNRSTPLYSTMMKVERYGMTRKPMMGPTKPGTKKGSGSTVDKLLGRSSKH